MAKKTFLHRGLVTKLDEKFGKIAGLFNLDRWWKETANKYFVAFNDTCSEECPIPLGQPLRLNADSENLESYNGTTWNRVNVASLTTDGAVTVTQETSKTTGVTANGKMGVITTVALTDAAGAYFEFTLTNDDIDATSVISLTGLNSGTGQLVVSLVSITSGSAVIRVGNADNSEAFNSLVKIHFKID